MISLVQMQYFQAVCRYENFTKAAEAMCISQPSMSAAMRKLEEECDLQLFIRKKNRVEITAEGKKLLSEVEYILGQFERLNTMVEQGELQENTVRVGMTTLSVHFVYFELLQRFCAKFPHVRVVSHEDVPLKLCSMLESGALDVIITPVLPADEAAFSVLPFCHMRHVLAVNKSNPLAAEKTVSFEQIAAQPLVLYTLNQRHVEWFIAEAHRRGLPLNIIHRTQQIHTVRQFVQSGMAASLLVDMAFHDTPDVVCLPFEGSWDYEMKLLWRSDGFLPGPVRDFLTIARQLIAERNSREL